MSDPIREAAEEAARATGAAVVPDWQAVVERPDLDVVVVSTPNRFLAEISIAALNAGKHVLVEKPMGRSLAEATAMEAAARAAGRVLKVGFNHRYHPALREAWQRARRGDIGEIVNVRCRYGHGGRPGYEREWRGQREMAGGGELTDQGVHVLDLLHWFLGRPLWVFGVLQTAVWPLGDLEDNAVAIARYDTGAVASLHTSWTQWKNQFALELTGRDGSLNVEGLGGSYGTESLTWHRRRAQGGPPDTERWEYAGKDESWAAEWQDFLSAVLEGGPLWGGRAQDGVEVMRALDGIYRSAAEGRPVVLGETG